MQPKKQLKVQYIGIFEEIKMHFKKEGQKIRAWVDPPPIIRAMPERKRFFSVDPFPKLYVKFWWPLFLALKFTFLSLNLAKIQIFIPKCTEGGGSTGSGNIPKNCQFF